MIKSELLVQLWTCRKEIDNAQNLLKEMDEQLAKKSDVEPTFQNAFGEHVGLQLGVPTGHNSHRIYGVEASLGRKVIEAHIENCKAKCAQYETEISISCQGEDTQKHFEMIKTQYLALHRLTKKILEESRYVDEDGSMHRGHVSDFKRLHEFPFVEIDNESTT
jgi:hypothetical protein